MFNIVILMCLFVIVRISSGASLTSVNSTIDTNCTKWLPMNVSDLWESCRAQYNTTAAWRCIGDQRLLIRFECTRLVTPTKCNEPKETQATEEPTTRHVEPKPDFLATIQEPIFLYGVSAGAVFLILIILLLSTVNCCLKKLRKKKSQCKLPIANHKSHPTHTQKLTADDVTDTTVIFEQRDDTSLAETQNASRHEVEGDASTDAVYEDVVRNPVVILPVDPDDDDDDDNDPTSQEQQPLYVNCNPGRVYMHLIKNKQQEDPTNLTKVPESSRQAEMKPVGSKGNLARPREKELPTGTQTAPRKSSVAYVNSHMAKFFQK